MIVLILPVLVTGVLLAALIALLSANSRQERLIGARGQAYLDAEADPAAQVSSLVEQARLASGMEATTQTGTPAPVEPAGPSWWGAGLPASPLVSPSEAGLTSDSGLTSAPASTAAAGGGIR